MFNGDAKAQQKAQNIVKALTAYRENKGTIDIFTTKIVKIWVHYEDCEDMGLNVQKIEDDQEFKDLVLTVHHCYMHALMNTPSFKIIENHMGTAFVKMDLAIQQQATQPLRINPIF